LTLSIDISSSQGEIVFDLFKCCKIKDFDGEKKFVIGEVIEIIQWLFLKKARDPVVWIHELEDFHVKCEEMETNIIKKQLLIHILKN
jgi:hypothetical protein